ncbi:MAG: MMPL family transporter [Paludibacteraceae bacterium]|nr:MMPL family transporter [Paludibacteraceae bacterium]
MKSQILHIYDWLSAHRRWLWGSVTALLVPLTVLAMALHYDEDIMDFLPVTAEDREALQVAQSDEAASRIVLIIEGDDEHERNDALYAVEDTLSTFDFQLLTFNLTDIYARLPYLIADSTYDRFDSLFTPESIRAALERDKLIISTPGAGAFADALTHDPLGLVQISNVKSQISNTNRSYAFVDSPYGGTETKRNAQLIDSLTAITNAVAANYPQLSIRWIGAPVIAVGNARRIKTDTMLCIALSTVLIIALLVYAFPRRRDILLILLAVSFGWLVGMAVLRLITPTVSAVVIGIGSVLIGIAVNYPLHLLVHQRYTTSVRQTLDEVISPLVVGNITTVAAFLTLLPMQAVALRHLGVFAASMLVGTIVFCIFILPHLMSAEPTPIREIKIYNRRLPLIGYQIPIIIITLALAIYLFVCPSELFDSNMSHINYMTVEQRADMASFQLPDGDASRWNDYWSTHSADSVIALIQHEADRVGFTPDAFEPFYQMLRSWKPIPAFDFGTIAQRLTDDFNYIGLCCSLIVFIFLWLSFRSLWLAIIAFVPMALSWIWIFAFMHMFDLHFNIVNVILATFIFGQGDDYTIFIVEGLVYEHQTGKPILPQYRQSIILSALIMLIGIGVLVLAVHPAMHSLGAVALIGMTTVVIMATTIPPLLWRFWHGICKGHCVNQ